MYISLQLARSNCYYGAWALSNDSSELPTAAATARVSATKAFYECSRKIFRLMEAWGLLGNSIVICITEPDAFK